MKYRIKAYHYKKESKYYPQYKFLWFWNVFDGAHSPIVSFSSEEKAQKFLDDCVDKNNPKIEWIPYVNNDWPPLVVGFIAFLVVSWVIGFSMGEKKTQQEAVKANVAEWILDQDGYVKFRFKQ